MTFGGYGALFVMEWAISATNDASWAGFVTKKNTFVQQQWKHHFHHIIIPTKLRPDATRQDADVLRGLF